MNNFKISKKIIILIVVVGLILLLMTIVFMRKSSQTIQTEPERSAPPSIGLIDPENTMISAFTSQDFVFIREALTNYIINKGGNGYTETLKINKVVTPYRDGDETTIDATVLSNNNNITIVVKLPTNGDVSTLSIPADNYSVNLGETD